MAIFWYDKFKFFNGCLRIVILSAVMLANMSSGRSFAATITSVRLPDDTWKVMIDGRINRDDDKKLFDEVKSVESGGGRISSIRFNSPGGYVNEGLSIARFIKKRGYMTVLENNSHCESICFFMFMHGNRKYIGRNVKLGMHGAARDGKNAPDVTWDLYEKHMDFFIPEYLGRGINGIPSTKMYYLTLEDLQALGLDCHRDGTCRSDVLN